MRISVLLLSVLPFLTNAPAQDKAAGKYGALVERVAAGDSTVDLIELRFACLESPSCHGEGDRDARKAMNQAFQERPAPWRWSRRLRLSKATTPTRKPT